MIKAIESTFLSTSYVRNPTWEIDNYLVMELLAKLFVIELLKIVTSQLKAFGEQVREDGKRNYETFQRRQIQVEREKGERMQAEIRVLETLYGLTPHLISHSYLNLEGKISFTPTAIALQARA